MFLQLIKIVLWPRRMDRPPRVVTFKPGKVNVITGASRTGKSAVIPIIDYCLAAGSCSIPVNTIRNACGWFGIVMKTPQGEKLLARREPGAQQVTDDMYVMEAPSIEVPDRIHDKNATAPQVRRMLDELSGLSRLDFSAGESTSGFSGRPSFRDMMAFVFQPQNIVANPDIFFFKADTQEHRQKLRNVFPYVLGAITAELLAKQHELSSLERELKRRERELNDAMAVSERWIAEVKSHVSNAKELGLLPPTTETNISNEALVQLLRSIVDRTDVTLRVTTDTLSESMVELEHLESEERNISRELTSRRHRLSEMKRLRQSTNEYNQALQLQRERLKFADWLSDQHTGDESCPICGNAFEEPGEQLQVLLASLRELEASAGVTSEVPAAFDLEERRVSQEVSQFTEKLEAVQIRRSALTKRSSAAQQEQYRAKRVERFVGNLENAIALYERLGSDKGLRDEVEKLQERVLNLRAEIDPAGVQRRLREALQRINLNAGRLLPNLDVENPDNPAELIVDDLTVRVLTEGRRDYLWQIGSGSNWLSYHLAFALGLQQYFLSSQRNPVPSLLVFDQPSQVYFPKKLVLRPNESVPEPTFQDEDVQAVRKTFAALSSVITNAEGKLQVVVLDHASEDVWGNLPNTVMVEEWRGGEKLVPIDWLSPVQESN